MGPHLRSTCVVVAVVSLSATAVPAWALVGSATPRSGGDHALAQVGLVLQGGEADAAGFAVAAGDLDGDGVDDVAVAAPCHAAGGPGSGAVHVVYGPVEGDRLLADADATLIGDEDGDFLGEGLDVVDLDGDGDDELLIGAPGPFVGAGPLAAGCFETPVQPGRNRPGQAYVVDGGSRLSGTVDVGSAARAVITGLTPTDFVGISVGGVGDVDGDGHQDLLVGGNGPGAPPVGGGSAYLFTGPLDDDRHVAEARAQLFGERPADLAGARVDGADVDGDGRSDLLIAAPGNAVPPANPGRVHLYYQPPSGAHSLATSDAILEGTTADDFTGQGLAVGDLLDGPAADVAIGAPGVDAVHLIAGGERLVGAVGLADVSSVRLERADGQQFGRALAIADLGGGSRAALVVGHPASAIADDGGGITVVDAPRGQQRWADATRSYTGEQGDDAGFSLATADVDGDGVDDIIVGAPNVSGAYAGKAYVVPGGAAQPAADRGGHDATDAPPAHAAGPDGVRAALPVTGAPPSFTGALLVATSIALRGLQTRPRRRLASRPRGHPTKRRAVFVVLALALPVLTGAVLDQPSPDRLGRSFDTPPCTEPDPCDYVWEGASLAPFELAYVEEVEVRSHDGTMLHGWLAFPDLPDGVTDAPVALHSSPYLGACPVVPCPGPGSEEFWADEPGPGPTRTWGVAPIELVRQGYVAAFFDVRGTGGSGGCFDFFSPELQRDQEALVDWLASPSQGWSNGRVGMGGNSAPAFTALAGAVQAPDGLKAIAVAGVVTHLYTNRFTPQGAIQNFRGYLALGPMLAAATLPPHLGNGHEALDEFGHLPARLCPEEGPHSITGDPTDGFRDDRDETYYEERNLLPRLGDITAATLLAHGFDDFGSQYEDSLVSALVDAPLWQITGQWAHGPPFAEEPALTPEWIRDNWRTTLFGWLGYWLQGVGDVPPDRVDYQDGTGRWHRSGTWPPANAREEVLYLAGDRVGGTAGDGDRTFVATAHPGNDYRSAQDGGVPAYWWSATCRQRLSDALGEFGVAYVGEPLTDGVLVAGNPFAYLRLSSTQEGGIVGVTVARLPAGSTCEDPAAELVPLTSGSADLRFHTGSYQGTAFPTGPDARTHVRVDLIDIAEQLHPGDRLVVLLHGSEDPVLGYYQPSPYSPRITVHADGGATASHVVLPLANGTLRGDRPSLRYPPRPFDPTPHGRDGD
ncbi:MAG: CocE/NonD family hydrolase [Actinobacteria bacterium]|nr:CocE/NonD family hydrolase [Actinomycetota bacterium]